MDIKNFNIAELGDKIHDSSAAESKKSRLHAEELKLKLRYTEQLCSAVVDRIRVILNGLNVDATPEDKLQYMATNVSALATTLSAEPANVRSQITSAIATADAWDQAGKKINDVVISTIEKHVKLTEMASGIKEGRDYNKPRKIGQRPESLKNIRQAKELLEEDVYDD